MTLQGSTGNVSYPFYFPPGDAAIKIPWDGYQYDISVPSSYLSAASKKWSRFLEPGPGWQIPGSQHPKSINFTDDNSHAIAILLNIAFLRFSQIPPKLTVEELFDVAILCDQYDCTKLVRAWLGNWMAAFDKSELFKGGDEAWLFISWVFRQWEIFETIVLRLFQNLGVDDKGEAMLYGKKLLQPMPLGVVEYILDCRLATISTLLAYPRNQLEMRTTFAPTRHPLCTIKSKPSTSKQCDIHICTALTASLLSIGVSLTTTTADIQVSISTFVDQVSGIKINALFPVKVKTEIKTEDVGMPDINTVNYLSAKDKAEDEAKDMHAECRLMDLRRPVMEAWYLMENPAWGEELQAMMERRQKMIEEEWNWNG